MHIRLTTPGQLTAGELAAWSRLQQDHAELDSPYFHPEFTRAVGRVRSDVEVAVFHCDDNPCGFFPFQRVAARAAIPVGGLLSDYQALIGPPTLAISGPELLDACGLSVWDFDHLLATQSNFQPFHRLTDLSPYIDVTDGFETYREGLRPEARMELQQTLRKGRKLAREVGALRFELQSFDQAAFEALFGWKVEQYRRTGVADALSAGWTTDLLRDLWRAPVDGFCGVLSVLYAGSRPVAAHFGMQSRHVLHWWFPAYDPAFATYSPGRVLLAELVRTAPTLGIGKIDLGRGMAPYKARAMTGTTVVAEGSIDQRPVVRVLRKTWRNARRWVGRSALGGPARVPKRILRRMSAWARRP